MGEWIDIIASLMLRVLIRGVMCEYLWNDFLIEWAGLSLPAIGFWHACFIAVLISLTFSSLSEK